MENKSQKPNFNFHCYSFNSLFGLDDARAFIQESYHKRIPNLEMPKNIYENAARSLNDLVYKSMNLQNQLNDLKASEFQNKKFYDLDDTIEGIELGPTPQDSDYESFEFNEAHPEEAAEITDMVHEILENEFNSSELGTPERENVLARLKRQHKTPVYFEKDMLRDNIRGTRARGDNPEIYKKQKLSMHLSSAFWSIPFCELSFQQN